MKLLLLIAADGHSFVNQTKALSSGLSKIGVEHSVVRISSSYSDDQIKTYSPDVVVGVGSWHSYESFVKMPQALGYRTVPWIVSDDKIDDFISEYNKLPLILTTSEYCKQVFIKGGIKEDKIKVVYEAVEDDFWKPLEESEVEHFLRHLSIREQHIAMPPAYDLYKVKEAKTPIIFTTGGDATSKGAQEMLKALGTINHSLPWVYLIKTWPSAGSFERSIEEMNLARSLGIYDRIRYISGEFSHEFIRGLIGISDIYAAPSRSEGFGLPLVEAQMSGKPVITVDATSTRETVEHGVTGFIVKRDKSAHGVRADIDDLMKHLSSLISDSDLRQNMGKNGFEKARNRFSPENIARSFMASVQA